MAAEWAWSPARGWFELDGQHEDEHQAAQGPEDTWEQWQQRHHDEGWHDDAAWQWHQQWRDEQPRWQQQWGTAWQSWNGSDQRRSWYDAGWQWGWNQDAWSQLDSASASHRVSGEDDGEGHRRESLPTTVDPKEHGDGGSVSASHPSSKSREPKTGKEFIPAYDGTSPLREYRRRVQLFLATTGIDPEFRGGRLVEQMSGLAWKSTETLQMDKLRSPQGVEYLLEHLQSELEPVEHLQVFGTLQTFFKSFRRARGEEFVTYDMNFRSQMQKLEEVGAGLSGIVKSWWFLECAGLSQELRKQVITASGGSYQYERLREALVAIVPTVKREGQDESSSSQPTTTGKKMFYSKKVINKVNMVDEQDETMPDGGEEEKTHEPGEVEDEAEIEEMERQAQVLMTQASRRRAKVEQNRGFQRQETADQREARIQEMKSRMCCSACKAHGKTVYGHWHGDPVCPFYGQQGKNPKKEEGKGVFVVTQAGDELEGTSDEEAFMVNVSTIFQTMSFDPDVDASRLALSDTCCARTVSGEAWMRRFMKQLWDNGIEYLCLAEQQGFRFGPGPKILSTYSVVVPTCLGTKENNVFLKISVVPVEVPLLVSRPALAQLGAVLDLHESEVNFKAVGTRGKLFTTTSGHVGFYIVDTANDQVQAAVPDLWDLAQAEEKEVIILAAASDSRTKGLGVSNVTPEPSQIVRDTHEIDGKDISWDVNVAACSSIDLDCPPDHSTSLAVAVHSVQSACEDDDVGTKAQGRVCGSHRSSELLQQTGPQQAHDGPLEGDLEPCQADQGPSAACRVAQIRSSRPEGSLCRHCPSHISLGGGRPLVEDAKGTTHHSIGNVPDRDERGHGPSGGGECVQCPPLQGVWDQSDSQDQQGDPGGILRMYQIPRMSSDAPIEHGGTGCSSARSQKPQEAGEGEGPRSGASTTWISKQGSRVGRFLDTIADRWRDFRGAGGRSFGQSHQHQFDQGRDEDDREDAGQGESQGTGIDGYGRQGHLSDGQAPEHDLTEPKAILSVDQIRERIAAGQHRRKQMKKGVFRRCLGNVKQIMMAMCLLTATGIGTAASQAYGRLYSQRPDVLEVFSGSAEISYRFARWGWSPMEPIDEIYGTDLREESNRIQLLGWIRKYRPRLVVVAFPCKWWSPITNVGYSGPQAQRRLHAQRVRERPFLQLCEDIFDLQMELGGDALGENPLNSHAFHQPNIKRILSHPKVYSGVGHGCRFGIKHYHNGLLLKKPTLWFSTSYEICDELSLRCENEKHPDHHCHGTCMGSPLVTAHAGRYTQEIAKAVHRGFIRLLKRKEPSRIRSLLRSVSVRIRKEGANVDLRWNEKSLKKALDRWNAVFAVDVAPPVQDVQPMETSGPSEEPGAGRAVDGAGAVEAEGQAVSLGTGGITFSVPRGRKLSEPIKQSLKKLHCNLGHPSKADLKRFLKLGGVTGEILEAVDWLECITCQHARKPKSHRVASIPPSQVVFGDEVQLDCFKIHDSRGKGHWFLSILDRATSYHIIKRLQDHAPETLYNAFRDGWVNWAGPPNQVTVDMEGGFRGRPFWEEVGQCGSCIVSIAGTAHWQAGKVERHNQIIKDILKQVINHTQVKGVEQIEEVALESIHAKNSLTREHGWSPATLVFGKEPRVFGELYEHGNPSAFHPDVGTKESQVARRMKYRYHAKIEFLKAQTKHMLGRAVHARTRKLDHVEVGQMVFFWRDDSKKDRTKGTNWKGPGHVVGTQGENLWIACGGRCFLVAREHAREVVGDEKWYGDPEIQKTIALFRKTPDTATYEDLTEQQGPNQEGLDIHIDDILDDVDEPKPLPENPPPIGITPKLFQLAEGHGWIRDGYGNPVLVTRRSWSFRTPTPKYDAQEFPFRSTWGFQDGKWICFERDVRWAELGDIHGLIPGGPIGTLVTVFHGISRKTQMDESVPWSTKRRRGGQREHGVHVVENHSKTVSKNRLKKMLDKEIPIDKISDEQRPSYQEAIDKEWKSWMDYQSCDVLSIDESSKVEKEQHDRILPSRFVLRDKNAGLKAPDGTPMPLKAKARLCLAGHLCPDSMSGELQLDSPTIERLSTMIFLHNVVSNGWLKNWFVGDISNAFLQGAPLEGKVMYMRQPKQGLPGLIPGQLLRLLKSVYGRPDAPRAWYNELARVLQEELGFQKSSVDPAMFYLRDEEGILRGLMIVHVDDLMLATDASEWSANVTGRLRGRFPFGTWQNVAQEPAGVTYCGKEIKIKNDGTEDFVTLAQKGFIEGRLECIQVSKQRAQSVDDRVNDEERTDYRSVVGSLQWLASQTRPDISFEVNQLQKRIRDLRVGDVLRANKCVKEVLSDRYELEFRNLGRDVEIVAFHDASLFNSVGVEIEDHEADDILLTGKEKKMVYSQKGAFIGVIKKGDMDVVGRKVRMNILDWKSTTNKRVVESSLAAETHAAILAHGLGRFVQAMMTESKYGPELITAFDDEDWQGVIPMNMITDCKSIYDSVKKDGQHLGDKGSIVQVILLRKMCSIKAGTGKAQLHWVPTRHQQADCLTKAGKGKALREMMGWAQFHEVSAAKLRANGTRIKEKLSSVNVACVS